MPPSCCRPVAVLPSTEHPAGVFCCSYSYLDNRSSPHCDHYCSHPTELLPTHLTDQLISPRPPRPRESPFPPCLGGNPLPLFPLSLPLPASQPARRASTRSAAADRSSSKTAPSRGGSRQRRGDVSSTSTTTTGRQQLRGGGESRRRVKFY